MTEQFKVVADEYQDTDDMGYAIAPPVVYYYVSNDEIGFNFDDKREANRFAEYINKLINENEQLKTKNFAYLQDIEVFKEENTHLKLETEQLKQELNCFKSANDKLQKEVIKKVKEKSELKQRNNRQAERLATVYNHIEKQDWKALQDIIEDFKECEEQLQKEYR